MITHISILLILAGGVVRGVFGDRGFVELREGDTKTTFQTGQGAKPLPFGLYLADFEVESYGDGGSDEASLRVVETDPHQGGLLHVQWPEQEQHVTMPVQVGSEKVLPPKSTVAAEAGQSYRIKILQYVPDFAVDLKTREVSSRSDRPHNPAILVAVSGPDYENHRWVFANFPDFVMHGKTGHPEKPLPLKLVYQAVSIPKRPAPASGPVKDFKSTLRVVEAGEVVQEKTIEVNDPLRYKGYTFYQSGYNPRDPSWTSLQVVRDPGIPLVYAGFGLMIVGLFIVFYLNPWIASWGKKS